MKSIVNYLKENGPFKGYIGKHEVMLEIIPDCIIMTVDEEKYNIDISNEWVAQSTIQDMLYEFDKTEVRFCEECGKPYDCGFMAGDGDWYCCEDCFEDAMNKAYGKGKWRGTEEEGYYGGFYEYLQDDGEWEDTGVFYTEWN